MAEIKAKTIFDILNDLTFNKVPWKDQDQKKVQTWMLNRWLSMHPDYLEIIAECQPMTDNLTPELWYRFYVDLLPKKKFFTKYISKKGDKEGSMDKLINFLSDKLQCSKNEMEDYLEILIPIHESEVKNYIRKFGYDDKSIKREFNF